MSRYKTVIRSWRDRNLKIWPTNYHLEVDDLEKNKKFGSASPRQIFNFQFLILVKIGSWQDRNLKIWPTNYHLEVDDLEKN